MPNFCFSVKIPSLSLTAAIKKGRHFIQKNYGQKVKKPHYLYFLSNSAHFTALQKMIRSDKTKKEIIICKIVKIINYIGETEYLRKRGNQHLHGITTFKKINERCMDEDFVYVGFDMNLSYQTIKDFETAIAFFPKDFNDEDDDIFFNRKICTKIAPPVNVYQNHSILTNMALAIFDSMIETPPALVGVTNKKNQTYKFYNPSNAW